MDGSANPKDTRLGEDLEEIVGIVTQAFGFYRILPLTNIKKVATDLPAAPPSTITSSGTCKRLSIGSYNVENLTPTSSYLPDIARHIVDYLHTPDLMFIQEIQDNNGVTNNGGM